MNDFVYTKGSGIFSQVEIVLIEDVLQLLTVACICSDGRVLSDSCFVLQAFCLVHHDLCHHLTDAVKTLLFLVGVFDRLQLSECDRLLVTSFCLLYDFLFE